jgi:DNA-binding NarL/FixJ family response regulator
MKTPAPSGPAPTSAGPEAHRSVLPGDVRIRKQRMKCLILAANGLTNAEIASELWLAEDSVKSHMRLVYEDLGARDRANAVAIAIVRGLIQPHQIKLRPPRSHGE